MNRRIYEFDQIRVIAAISVIIIHVTAIYSSTSSFAYYSNQLVRYAVPIFILLSGFLLHFSNADRELSYLNFLSKRFKKILIPYLVWSIIYILFENRSNLSSVYYKSGFLVESLTHIIRGTAYPHLYFVIIIIQMYLLYPFLKVLLGKYPKALISSSFLLTLFFQTAVYMSLLKAVHLPKFIIPYYIFFPTWLFYFIFGMYLSENTEKVKVRIKNNRIQLIALWFAGLFILLVDSRITGTGFSSIKPSTMLYCLLSFFAFYSVLQRFQTDTPALRNTICWISAQSYTLYLSHMLVLSLIITFFRSFGLNSVLANNPGMVLLFLLTLALSLIFTYVISLTPFATLFGGVGKKTPGIHSKIQGSHTTQL
ncbi:MAG: acyltransferase [Clostridia bacterium]|nr:acyltransferase [Clostridia bacterium]